MADVRKIIEIINREGRQGPKDLKSKEVYDWVRNKIKISYVDYKKILDKNAISYKDRQKNRNAYFVIDNKGQYQLLKSKEDEIRKYLCYVVRENPGITTKEAREKLKIIYQDYTLVDLMDQKNLLSPQDIIDQTIRNVMVSNYDRKKNFILFEKSDTKPFTFKLKEAGYKLASEVDKVLAYHNNIDYITETDDDFNGNVEIEKGLKPYTEEELKKKHEENKHFNYLDHYAKSNNKITTDSRLKITRFNQTKYHCEVDENHITFPTSTSPNFLEGHHLVRMAAQKNFPSTNLDCIENIVSLCPNCHMQIHHGTKEAKLKIFNKILEKRGEDLKSIGFSREILQIIFDIYYK